MINFIELNGVRYELDHKGFLADMSRWDSKIGNWFAMQEGVELFQDHQKIIEFLRGYFGENKNHPGGRLLTRALAQMFGREKGTGEYFIELFPGGLHQAYRIAGLPMQHTCC